MTRMVRTARPAPVVEAPSATIAYKEDDSEGSSSKVDYRAVTQRYMEKITNRGSAIRAFCVGCSGGQLSEVRDCQVKKCALYPYRMGTDPGNLKSIKRLAKQAAEEGEE